MADHVYEEHTNCERPYCNICEGGLSVCSVCGLLEGCLTTECPGEPSFWDHNDAVYEGLKDFRDGRWQEGVMSKHCPPYFKKLVEEGGS